MTKPMLQSNYWQRISNNYYMESYTPKISVIVPVYNVEKYLSRCIDSILAQTFTDFELLLIDDGSKDKSGEICDEYANKDNHVKVFHKENGGVSSARNLGLDNAQGEWITFVDSDDFVNSDWLSYYAKSFDVDLIVQGYQVIEADLSKSVVVGDCKRVNGDLRYDVLCYLAKKLCLILRGTNVINMKSSRKTN